MEKEEIKKIKNEILKDLIKSLEEKVELEEELLKEEDSKPKKRILLKSNEQLD